MAWIILSFLLAVGVWADHTPLKHLHDNREFGRAKKLSLETNQGDIEIENESAIIVQPDQLSVVFLQEDSENGGETDSVEWDVQLLLKDTQYEGEIRKEKTSVAEVLQPTVKPHQENNGIEIENDSPLLAGQLHVKTHGSLIDEVYNKVHSGCQPPFQKIGSLCYFFSDKLLDFSGAKEYCESLSHGHISDINLAMLDYEEKEDLAILAAVAAKNTTFWFGGKTEDGIEWKWLDDRYINLQANFWHLTEPNKAQNRCTVAQVINHKIRRSYLFAYECVEAVNFICQTNICPKEFRRIGHHCYLLSAELGITPLPWQHARNYCQTLSVPMGYRADLAVLGLPDQDGYQLMNNLVAGYADSFTWLGAFPETGCDFKWVDGRSFPKSPFYWHYTSPDCGRDNRVKLYHYAPTHRTYLIDYPGSYSYPFICQMFKDD
ncbi:unnamed protein product [Meganyctiphanes norvegica]|uniref:C-type lectin domain-containing protein n=1 Tax=Meganyctiphanes norvegica TaxID=48144 RepID=A0AAV2PSB7_MEGNR